MHVGTDTLLSCYDRIITITHCGGEEDTDFVLTWKKGNTSKRRTVNKIITP